MGNRCMTPATCHPDRWKMSRGLCAGCYRRWLKKSGRLKPAPCHPDKTHYAKGLCGTCWRKNKRQTGVWPSETKEARLEFSKSYRERWKTKIREREKAWYYSSPKSVRNDHERFRKQVLSTRYGLTPKDVSEALKRQNGACAICGTNTDLVVDHCHTTLRFRAMLCRPCNFLLGYAKDNISILTSSIAYLVKHGGIRECA